MEEEGLRRAVRKLGSNGMRISEMVTDRHKGIASYIRNELPETKHYFDVWHIAKGNVSSLS